VKTLVAHFEKDGSGATAIEYALIAAGIAGAIMAVVLGLGSELRTTFGDASTAMDLSADQASSDTSSSDQTSSDTDSTDTGRRRRSDRHSGDRHTFDHHHFQP
jgi:pilus assembly protein Flp/PilA